MRTTGQIVNSSTHITLLERAEWCESFFCKLRGLMFRKHLGKNEGLLMVEVFESRAAASIHMLFMAFPIAVIWLDRNFRIIDMVIAYPWRIFYAPRIPAQYTLEAHPDILERVSHGDLLEFVES